MANQDHLAIIKQGVTKWTSWRHTTGSLEVDLSEADLTGANLDGIDFYGINLQRARLIGTSFYAADLRNANLQEANLSGANFFRADLRDTNLRGANLIGANLDATRTKGTDFNGAFFGDTIFGAVNLDETLGLENVAHISESMVATSTLRNSGGKLPEAFLRGCGLSDMEIETAKLYSLDLSEREITDILYRIHDLRVNRPLQISPLFISYSHADKAFVDRIEKSLNEKGVRFWRDIHDMKAGRMETQIDRAISQNPTVLLILSENSIKSDWVQHEVRKARELEKEIKRDVLCPAALDDSWKTSSWPKRIMEQIVEYNILDFSIWKDDSEFESMFSRLVNGLNIYYRK